MRLSIQSVPAILIIFICAFFFSCPQSEQVTIRTNALSVEELESGNASITYTEALVTFVSGEVYVKGTSDWEYLEIGNIVHSNETIKVSEDSLCELQFGENSVVRIQENTEIHLKDFWLEPEQTAVDIYLALGTILCKVSKLSAAESFKIRTRTAVCGVRGTEFMVSVTSSKDTVLAVKEGKVAIIPPSVESDRINEEAEIENVKVKALVKKIEDSALVIEANQEVTIDEETAKETARIVSVMVDEVKQVDQKEELTEEELERVNTLITKTNEKINKVINRPQEIKAENKQELKSLDQIEIKKVRVVPSAALKEKPKAETEKVVPALKVEKEEEIAKKEKPKTESIPSEDKATITRVTDTEERQTEEKNCKIIDEFNSPIIDSQWFWVRENPDAWSLTERPGYMTITTEKGDLWKFHNDGKNILIMNILPLDLQIDTKLEIYPTNQWHNAKIIVYCNDDNYVAVGMGFYKVVDCYSERYGNIVNKPHYCSENIVYLRLVKKGNKYTGYFSIDGINYTFIGEHNNSGIKNLKVGICADSGDRNPKKIKAYFDYFQITYMPIKLEE